MTDGGIMSRRVFAALCNMTGDVWIRCMYVRVCRRYGDCTFSSNGTVDGPACGGCVMSPCGKLTVVVYSFVGLMVAVRAACVRTRDSLVGHSFCCC